MRRISLPLAALSAIILTVAAAAYTVSLQAQQREIAPTDTPIYVMPKSGPFTPEKTSIPQSAYIIAWTRSGHSNISSTAFSYWNKTGAIPPVCSVCHSGPGFRSFHGLDGSKPGLPDHPVPTGGVVDCETCHNQGLSSITQIAMPSGLMHPVSSSEASCMTCHQGRAAGSTVVRATDGMADDTPNPTLIFINPHYGTAAATVLGGYGRMGYQYPDKSYSGRFLHARPVETCVSCHDPHSLQVAEQTCLTCHATGNAADIRISRISFDGSGNLGKGIRQDISANAEKLMEMLEQYAASVAGLPLHYDGSRHPYFFADANKDRVVDQAQGKAAPYNAWTPRMLKAAYNWKFVGSDKGIHVHNPHYALELLHDSIQDLSVPLGVNFDTLNLKR